VISNVQEQALAALALVWALSPEVRLGQLLAHLDFLGETHLGRGLGNLEDEELVAILYHHRTELEARSQGAADPAPHRTTAPVSINSTDSAKKDYRAHAKQYHQAIRRVLLHDWDPIGIANEPKAHDEYDNYIHQIHGMLIRHEPKHKLFDHLWWLETEQIGLSGSRSRTEKVVDLLIALRKQIEAKT
jgi:hypothetical protein